MNCRSEVLEVSVEGRQVEEAMLAVLHTVLLHRSTGKFHYKKEGTYSIGTVGTQDVDCDFIDFTYVRVSSEELDRALRKVVGEFKVGVWHGGWQAHHKCLPPPPGLLLDWPSLHECSCWVFPCSEEQMCSLRGGGLWTGQGKRLVRTPQGGRADSPRVPSGAHCPPPYPRLELISDS